jgi:acyl carrier protein
MEPNTAVRQLIASQLGVDLSELIPSAQILDDLGADSLDVVELVMALEERFGLEIPDADVVSLRTIGDVEAYLTKRLLD